MNFLSTNPYNQQPLAQYALMNVQQVNEILAISQQAFDKWKRSSFTRRAHLLEKVADLLDEQIEILSKLISLEMGKPLAESRSEIRKCASVCRFYAGKGEAFLAPEKIATEAEDSGVYFEPTGCVFAIMPWNFPFWQVFRYAAPCLMAGNVCLLKHAPTVTGCALKIEELLLAAGFDEGVFQTVIIDLDLVEPIIEASIISGVAFTGSEAGGAKVAALSAKHLKKVVLELGGSDAFIVLADADLEKATQMGVLSRMVNSGQACNGAKRFIIERSVFEQFSKLFIAEVSKIRQGDPLDPAITMGPLSRLDLVANLENQLVRSIADGAHIAFRGPSNGCNISPIVLTGVRPGMAAFDEETFGPLAALIIAEDAADAVRLANLSRYGLAASLWSADKEKVKAMVHELEAGNVFVNAVVRSDSRLPFGGIKKSGYGRELSKYGIHEFVNIKTFYIES